MNLFDDRVLLRENAIQEIAGLTCFREARRILFVVDETALRATGAEADLAPAFAGRGVVRFSGFEANPKLADVERGVELGRAFRPDLVLAFGGGTAIDLGKLVSVTSAQDAFPRDVCTGRAAIQTAGPPLVAVPTTAGTGAEATHFAVVYVDGEKHSVAHPFLRPSFAVVDPRLTYALPASITADCGLDALCQALESIWAVGATDQSVLWAEEAARLALAHLPQAVREPTPEARAGMCRAAHLAGRAIDVSKTTAPHALSYPLTSRKGTPHGAAVAATFASLLEFNAGVGDSDCADPRGADHVRRRIAKIVELLGGADAEDAARRFRRLVASVGRPASLADAGVVDDAELRALVAAVNVERLSNNPRRASSADLFSLLRSDARNASPTAAGSGQGAPPSG